MCMNEKERDTGVTVNLQIIEVLGVKQVWLGDGGL